MRIRLGCTLAVATAALLLGVSAPASAAIPFCTFGTDPGQCKEPSGVAVDTSNGRVYVADTGNDRINVFDEDGNFLLTFGTSGAGPGQLTRPRAIAVDDDPTSPAFHDVYVVDNPLVPTPEDPFQRKPRVQRFSPSGAFVLSLGEDVVHGGGNPVAVGAGGTIYVGDDNSKEGPGAINLIKRFTPAGVLLGSSSLPETTIIDYLTIDSAGHAYVSSQNSTQSIAKYELSEPNATLLNSFDLAANTTALAVDSADNLYSARVKDGLRFITRRDPSGSILKRFGYDEIQSNLLGLAGGVGGDLFGSESAGRVIRIPQPPPGAVPCCLTATPGNTKATLKGAVNPEGKAATYHFEYLTEADYLANGSSFTGPNLPAETPESAPVGSDFELYPAEAQIGCSEPEVPPQDTCLEPGTAYRYRLVAKNADGENSTEAQFTTKPPFELLETYASEAGTDAVRLHATVNPVGIPATAYFEYVDDASHQATGFDGAAKTPTVDLGSGSAPKATSAQLSSLAPGTTYHYRVVVTNAFTTEAGPERTVTTFPLPSQPTNSCPNSAFRTGPSAFLPDCRAYEMVSPVDKNGGDIKVLLNPSSFPARLDQSADDGNGFTYSAAPAFANPQSAPYVSQYLAKRGTSGWSNEAINPPRESAPLTDQIQRYDAAYKLFSADLDEGWLFQDANPSLDECAPEGFVNLYRRNLASGKYEALIPAKPPAGDPLEGYRLELQGTSADRTRSVFRANTKLTKDAANTSGEVAYQLYMHIRDPEGGCGELRLVSFKPNGVASTQPASAGSPRQPGEYRESMVARTVSEDGRRVLFTLTAIASSIANGAIYVRVNADQPQSAMSEGKCSEPEKGCTLEVAPLPPPPTLPPQYWSAAADGSVALYSVGGELFEYDVDKALAGEAARTLIAGDLPGSSGVVAASEDASRIFFVSEEEIEGEGKAGEPNLYLYEPDKAAPERYRLVGTLAASDLEGQGYVGTALASSDPIRNGVRLTADGEHLAFVSKASLTGYDNRDARDGKPNLELFLYGAQSGELRCVSCNPSGARPQGREIADDGAPVRVSAMMPAQENTLFSPRALLGDGSRLFFESFEALSPRDTNGKADAYQWQRAASQAECDEAGAELYVPSADGCLSLISSGQSPLDTEIADVSADGSNVFLRTVESLLPQDPGQIDVYDVRVNGGFPQPPGQPAACEGEACQGPISAPNDPTPSSLSFQGAGNVKEAKAKAKKKKAKKKQRKKKQRAKRRGSGDGDAHRRGPR